MRSQSASMQNQSMAVNPLVHLSLIKPQTKIELTSSEGESACNVTDESFEADEAVKATHANKQTKLMQDAQKIAESLIEAEEALQFMEASLQSVIALNEQNQSQIGECRKAHR
jgi:hypothetical protein